jgi:hypothetical protein
MLSLIFIQKNGDFKNMKEFIIKAPDQELMRDAIARGTRITNNPDHDLLVYSEKRREAKRNISADVAEIFKAHSAVNINEPTIDTKLVEKLVRFVEQIIK